MDRGQHEVLYEWERTVTHFKLLLPVWTRTQSYIRNGRHNALYHPSLYFARRLPCAPGIASSAEEEPEIEVGGVVARTACQRASGWGAFGVDR
jgi:hypothetical protein